MAWPERILIVGAGAVGSFVGARLALAGMPVILIGRNPFVEAVRKNGLKLIEPEGQRQTTALAAVTSLAEAEPNGLTDLAFLTMKAYDTEQIARELKAIAPAAMDSPVLACLQNGIGNEEVFAETYGPAKIVAGALETPVSMPEPGVVVVHRSRYRVGVAPVAGRRFADFTAKVLENGGLHVTLYDDHRRLKWSKLLLNLPANATCAILDWTPARCMAHPVIAALEARAWQEAFRVMAARGIRPVNLAGYPLRWIAPLAPALPPALLAKAMAQTVAGGRGSKMPSFHVALTAGKRSEVAWINGAVARAGIAVGVATPVNSTLASTLSAISAAPETWPDWQNQPHKLADRIASAIPTS